jgi:purine-nucleoside phosphorylase
VIKKVKNQMRTLVLNAGMKFISLEEKLSYMFFETSLKNLRPFLIVVVTEPCLDQLINKLKNNKDYRKEGKIHNGNLVGVPVSVVKSEMGAPNPSIIMEMAVRAKAQVVLRVDVCGSLNPQIPIGNVIIPPIALRGEGTSEYYYRKYKMELQPGGEKCHEDLFKLVKEEISHQKVTPPIHYPIIWTSDSLFCEDPPEIERWRALGADAVDMETSIMYLLGNLFHIPTLAIMGITDIPGSLEYDLFHTNKLHPEMVSAIDRAVDTSLVVLPAIARKFLH